ncbi:putative glutathione S-transferase [Tieghemostelium lacteum]|uniref:Putative glutathione S-transferase n=1 Tax=Tieghemostelium lacteum TaxID=361077 RepID=A0A152A5R5_TIELA|nr:putative glutathione S-transferase [Tieghemostelium lacteum]|eukprot:KYR01407.1 putative glutathione S-transferase [Tieghemostelium lacteum]
MTSFSSFANNITADGKFQPESGRYHLVVGLGCPFAHRALIAYKLKGLESAIDLSVVDFEMKDGYWKYFGHEGTTPDPLYGFQSIKQLYDKADPQKLYTGKATVPVLWDRKTETIVSNESHDIVRIFNSQLNNLAKYPNVNLYPDETKAKIDEATDFIMKNIAFQVYKTTSQEEYELSFKTFFNGLENLNERLSKSRYLAGNAITEADIKLFVVLIRFEPAFYNLKYNLYPLSHYDSLFNYIKDLYQNEFIKPTVNFYHIKGIYYTRSSLPEPRLVPIGPNLDHYEIPHNRVNL